MCVHIFIYTPYPTRPVMTQRSVDGLRGCRHASKRKASFLAGPKSEHKMSCNNVRLNTSSVMPAGGVLAALRHLFRFRRMWKSNKTYVYIYTHKQHTYIYIHILPARIFHTNRSLKHFAKGPMQ